MSKFEDLEEFSVNMFRDCTYSFLSILVSIHSLIFLQKRVIKISLKMPIGFSTKLCFDQFKVLNIKQMFYNVLLKYVHKHLNSFEKCIHKYKSKNMNVLFEPKCKSTAALQHSMSQGPRL